MTDTPSLSELVREVATDIVDMARDQNWKNGGVHVLDRDEAIENAIIALSRLSGNGGGDGGEPLPDGRLKKMTAYFTHSRIHEDGGHLYYFAPVNAAEPPYRKQIEVTAILDIAADGTLAGVELIDPRMPPPPPLLQAASAAAPTTPVDDGAVERKSERHHPSFSDVTKCICGLPMKGHPPR